MGGAHESHRADTARRDRTTRLSRCACLRPPDPFRREAGPGRRIWGRLPAIPIAIIRPNLDFTLIEVSRKKISFLRHVVRLLALSRVHPILGRAEEIVEREADMAATFDLASARAVAPLAKIGTIVFPFLRPGGVFLAQVGSGRETDAALGRLIDMGFDRAGEIPVPAWIGAPSHEILALRKSVGR